MDKCEYCNDTNEQKVLYHANHYEPYTCMQSNIDINRQQDGRHLICVDLWQDGNAGADFEVFYCPMCGRKL